MPPTSRRAEGSPRSSPTARTVAPTKPFPGAKNATGRAGARPPSAKSATASPPPQGGKSTALYLLQMLITTAGIYACFFCWGIVHERIAAHHHVVDGQQKKFRSYIVTTLITGLCTTITATLCLMGLSLIGRPVQFVKVDLKKFVMVGGTMTFAGPLGLTAAKNLSYPVYLTVKMCKMVPSVIVGALWHRFSYTWMKYLAVLLITAGVLSFSLLSAPSDAKPALESQTQDIASAIDFDATKVIAVATAFVGMTLDGYTVSTQDALNRDHAGLHSLQLMLGSGLAQMAWCFASLAVGEVLPASLHTSILKPEFREAVHFFNEAPQALYDVVLLGALNSFGQVFVLTGVGLFGGLTLVAIMTTRKVGSVFISIAAYGHQVTTEQWFALIAVVVGVVVDTVDGVRNKNKKKAKAH